MNGRQIGAHRLAYEEAYGPIPDGMVIDHLCRNRACVNPAHLEAVTHEENCRRGRGTKLRMQQVLYIRELEGRMSSDETAEQFGVHRATINDIWRRRTWADV